VGQIKPTRLVSNFGHHFARFALTEKITAEAVVLTLGASHRRLDARGLEQFTGRGVLYGAPQYHVPEEWEGKRVGIVGGGNSAAQAALFLSNCKDCEVNVFVRGASLEQDMSQYLWDHVSKAKNIQSHPFSTLRQVNGNGEWMTEIMYEQQRAEKTMALHYLLVQIGAEPQTGWLEGEIELDDRGYIKTDRDVAPEKWPKNAKSKGPSRFETSLPGVFAGGDCHSGSPNRMSIAIGEGHALAVTVYRYLALRRQANEDRLLIPDPIKVVAA
jgi:thioredoxin reductase (NADPH)